MKYKFEIKYTISGNKKIKTKSIKTKGINESDMKNALAVFNDKIPNANIDTVLVVTKV